MNKVTHRYERSQRIACAHCIACHVEGMHVEGMHVEGMHVEGMHVEGIHTDKLGHQSGEKGGLPKCRSVFAGPHPPAWAQAIADATNKLIRSRTKSPASCGSARGALAGTHCNSPSLLKKTRRCAGSEFTSTRRPRGTGRLQL